MSNLKKYFLLFAQDYIEFRYPEIESILKVFNINVQVPRVEPIEKPYWILENISESDVRKIASRSVSIKFVAEYWTGGKTLEEFHENARNYVKFVDKSYSTQSFKFIVESFNKHLKLAQRIEKIETLTYFDKAFGQIDLINPVNKFVYFEYHGLKNNMPELEEIIIGKWISDGRRDLIHSISLKERKFIGNTSMEAQLSLLMANQGLCKENELMFDPFVGTGSLLISCALFGSYVMGADIDFLTLHAKNKPVRAWKKSRESDESIRANFEQYQLLDRYLDVFVGDFSNCPLHSNLIFDSIVCDRKYKNHDNYYQTCVIV